ncbi:hypothetical protein MKEN_00303200 [Mycena kentingensis (nom. inval.)]|nr:hypothetical protein MKEN_00303200 [Mycena kentingensis (nom. inval.)]
MSRLPTTEWLEKHGQVEPETPAPCSTSIRLKTWCLPLILPTLRAFVHLRPIFIMQVKLSALLTLLLASAAIARPVHTRAEEDAAVEGGVPAAAAAPSPDAGSSGAAAQLAAATPEACAPLGTITGPDVQTAVQDAQRSLAHVKSLSVTDPRPLFQAQIAIFDALTLRAQGGLDALATAVEEIGKVTVGAQNTDAPPQDAADAGGVPAEDEAAPGATETKQPAAEKRRFGAAGRLSGSVGPRPGGSSGRQSPARATARLQTAQQRVQKASLVANCFTKAQIAAGAADGAAGEGTGADATTGGEAPGEEDAASDAPVASDA